jgi:PAS domain S-box-containing protein
MLTIRTTFMAAGGKAQLVGLPVFAYLLRKPVIMNTQEKAETAPDMSLPAFQPGSEQLPHQILNGLPDPALFLMQDGTVLCVNEALCRLSAQNKNVLTGSNAGHWLLVDRTPANRALPGSLSARLLDRDGCAIPVFLRITPAPYIIAGCQLYVLQDRRCQLALEEEVLVLRSQLSEGISMQPQLEAERRFQNLFHSGMIGFVYWSKEGRILDVNDAFLQIVGYTREEFLQDGFRSMAIGAPEYAATDDMAQQDLQSHGSCRPYQKEFVRRNGTRVPVLFGGCVLDPANRNHVFSYAIDITDQVQTATELRRSVERFDIAMQATNDGVWEWDMLAGEVYYSPRWYEIVGYAGRESEIEHTIDAWRKHVHPDYRAYVDSRIRMHLEQRVPYEVVYQFVLPDGETRWHRSSGQALFDENGKPYKMAGSVSDVTHQKLVEEQVIREKEFANLIINSLPGIFFLVNVEGALMRWNNNLEVTTGYRKSELSGRAFISMLCQQEGKDARGVLRQAFATGSMSLETYMATRKGDLIPYYFYGIVFQYNGRPHLAGMGIDITLQKSTEEQLMASLDQIRELATHLQDAQELERKMIAQDIHDELGQSLTAVKMDLARVIRLGLNASGAMEHLTDALNSVDQSISTVRRLATDLRPKMLDDLGIFAAVEWYVSAFARRTDLEVGCHIEGSDQKVPPTVSIALFRIVQESLTNVLRHASARRVEVSLVHSGHEVRLIISDDGEGFDPEREKASLSLGLLGIRERTQAIGGRFVIQSAPGRGTEVSVRVPVTETD